MNHTIIIVHLILGLPALTGSLSDTGKRWCQLLKFQTSLKAMTWEIDTFKEGSQQL